MLRLGTLLLLMKKGDAMTKSQYAYWSAGLNLAGSILLFVSFQATSTRLLLVAAKGERQNHCVLRL